MNAAAKPPAWFLVLGTVLLLWNLLGAYACVQQFRLGAEAYAPTTAYDRALFAAMPWWYDWTFALAEVGGVGGAVLLLLRRPGAVSLFAISLLCVLWQYGYLFAATDMIAVKGVWTTYFPLFIAAVCAVQLWLARLSLRRGWTQGALPPAPAL